MKILITGGLGFIGQATCKELLSCDHEIFVYTHRKKESIRNAPDSITLLDSESVFPKVDAIVNLAGESIARKMLTRKRCLELLNSRIKVMDLLLDKYSGKRFPEIFIQASATGIYSNDQLCGEEGDTCGEFSELVTSVEYAALKRFNDISCLTLLRLGVVMGDKGGLQAILKFIPPLRIVPDPENLVPWVKVEDAARIIKLLLNKPCRGIVNAASDEFKTANELLAVKGKHCICLPLPRFLLALPFDRRGALLLASHRILSNRIRQLGFEFEH